MGPHAPREDVGITIFVTALVIGAIATHWIAATVKEAHVRRQNRLVERARTLFVLATSELGCNNRDAATALLQRIRAIESRWRLGSSRPFKTALACKAIGYGIVANIVLRIAGLIVAADIGNMQVTLQDVIHRLVGGDGAIVVVFSLLAAPYALAGYLTEWSPRWLIDDFGDRLARLLNAGRAIATTPLSRSKRHDRRGPIHAWELLGLPPNYSKRELSAARRRMAAQYHPDRWASASQSQRMAVEEAMKSVNAAYEAALALLVRR